MWYSIAGIVLSFVGTAFSLWKILMRDERIAGTWRGLHSSSSATLCRFSVISCLSVHLQGGLGAYSTAQYRLAAELPDEDYPEY